MKEPESLEEIMLLGMLMELSELCEGNEKKKAPIRNSLVLMNTWLILENTLIEEKKNEEFESLREMVENSLDHKRDIENYTDSQLQTQIWFDRFRSGIYCFFHGKSLKNELKNNILKNVNLAVKNASAGKAYSKLEDCLTGFLKEKKDVLEKDDYTLVSEINGYSVELQRAYEWLSSTFIKKIELYTEIYHTYYPNKINAEAKE